MTDLFEGLGAVLRKTAKTTQEIMDESDIAEESLREVLEVKKWLHAGLVEKEMSRIKEELRKELAANSEYDHDLKADIVRTKIALKKVEGKFLDKTRN